MRKSFSRQRRLDCKSTKNVILNFECRHEIVPILSGLQYIYSEPVLRDDILKLIAQDVNQETRDDCGRRGMDYWQILVLSSVRLGCDLTYDALQDLAEQHRALRHIMGVGDWEEVSFNWRRIHENICLVRPKTIAAIVSLRQACKMFWAGGSAAMEGSQRACSEGCGRHLRWIGFGTRGTFRFRWAGTRVPNGRDSTPSFGRGRPRASRRPEEAGRTGAP
jgi:hypothetical protein